MRKIVFCAGLLFIGGYCWGQVHSCATEDISYEQFLENNRTPMKLIRKQWSVSAGKTYIPIKVHFFADDSGFGFANENNVNSALAELNKEYKANNIEFYFVDFSKYRNSEQYNSASSTKEDEFHATNGVKNAINLYLRYNLVGNAGGYSYIFPKNQYQNRISIKISQINDGKTATHEFGHYFGLNHTFQGQNAWIVNNNDPFKNRELVTRNFHEAEGRRSANCDKQGDFLCDTPADPYGRRDISVTACSFTEKYVNENEKGLDLNGDHFFPQTNNYMSYYEGCSLPFVFTDGQREVINTTAEKLMNNTEFSLDAPETAQPAPTQIKVSVSDYSNGENIISWKDNSTAETGYIIEASEVGKDDFTAIGGVQTNTNQYKITTPLDYDKEWIFRVKPSNSKTLYSENSQAVKISKLCANDRVNRCNTGILYWNSIINSVTLSKNNVDILKNTNTGCSPSGIHNYFPTHTANVGVGDTITFKVEPKYSRNYANLNIDASIYCDWNQDNDFDDEGETLATFTNVANAQGTFKVPEQIKNGKYRLRISLSKANYGTKSCSAMDGEIEDYALVVNNSTLSTDALTDKIDGTTLYPNPAQNEFFLKSNEEIKKVKIFDLSGKLVKVFGKQNSYSVQDLPKGVYLVLVNGKEKIKLVK